MDDQTTNPETALAASQDRVVEILANVTSPADKTRDFIRRLQKICADRLLADAKAMLPPSALQLSVDYRLEMYRVENGYSAGPLTLQIVVDGECLAFTCAPKKEDSERWEVEPVNNLARALGFAAPSCPCPYDVFETWRDDPNGGFQKLILMVQKLYEYGEMHLEMTGRVPSSFQLLHDGR